MYKKHWRGTLRATVALTGTGGGHDSSRSVDRKSSQRCFRCSPAGNNIDPISNVDEQRKCEREHFAGCSIISQRLGRVD